MNLLITGFLLISKWIAFFDSLQRLEDYDCISVTCPEGKFRTTEETECVSCDLGEQPNSDKTQCGK